jgi:murein L,D-transpeptidase YafK
MFAFRLILALSLALGLSACAPSKFKKYKGPEVTQVQVHKAERKMYLLHNDKVLKAYDIGLGQQPVGHKQFEGDLKTPEGVYYIDRRNPNSNYHLSIGISYPNPADREFAEAAGQRPGGEIFVHGNNGKRGKKGDWTWGCIAVTDKEMEDVYAMVRDGTPIYIMPDARGFPPAPPPAVPLSPEEALIQLANAED